MEARILRINETSSTNSLLREMADKGAEHGQVIIALRQTGGRGRQGRSFASPVGGLYLSYLYRPETELPSPGALTAGAAVAVCRALESFGVQPGIKWVNDLFLGGRKICGILCEALSTPTGMAYIIGVGLNVSTPQEAFPPEVRDIAGSIFSVSGQSVDIEALAQAIIRALDELGGDCLEYYRSRCICLGQEVLIMQGGRSFRAFAQTIDEDFSLIVRHQDGKREKVSFGEVSVRI